MMTVQPWMSSVIIYLSIHIENSHCGCWHICLVSTDKFMIPWVESTHQKQGPGPKPAPAHYHFTLPDQVTLTAEEGASNEGWRVLQV